MFVMSSLYCFVADGFLVSCLSDIRFLSQKYSCLTRIRKKQGQHKFLSGCIYLQRLGSELTKEF